MSLNRINYITFMLTTKHVRMLDPMMTSGEPCRCPQDTHGGVPMADLMAVLYGDIEPCRNWIAQGRNINASLHIGYNFLYASCCGGHDEILEELLQHPDIHLNKLALCENTALMSSARWGRGKCIVRLLSTKPKSHCRLDITAKDFEGLTAMAIAARYKRWKVLPYLLIQGVEYDQKNLDAALLETVNADQWDLVTALLQNYQGFYSKRLSQVLFKAVECREIKVLRSVLDFQYPQCDTQTLEIVRRMTKKIGYGEAEILLTYAIDGYHEVPMPFKFKDQPRQPFENNDVLCLNPLMEKLTSNLGVPSVPLRTTRHKTFDGRPLLGDSPSYSSPVLQQPFEVPFLPGGIYSSPQQQPWMPQMGRLQLNVIPVQMAIPPGPEVYDTTSVPRGIVLILNYNEFKNRPDMLREGSYLDVLNMRNLCDQMGYETQVHYNLTSEQTLATLEAFRSQVRLGRVSCILVAIMSHGISRHTFYTSDMNTITVNELQTLFLDNQCPLLKNKPKIFLFNFCRGSDIPAYLETDAVREQPRNILCIYSTTESFLSYRDKKKGCPFIVALCEVLANHAHEMDLDNLIRKFQQKYLPNTTPEIQNLGFYKKFYFNPIGFQNQQKSFVYESIV